MVKFPSGSTEQENTVRNVSAKIRKLAVNVNEPFMFAENL